MSLEKHYLSLNDVSAYRIAFRLSNKIWEEVVSWDHFAKDTIGKQFVRSIDSISSNIAEGFGRFHKNDKIKFYYYSMGSIKESLDWNEKSKSRKLISEEKYLEIYKELIELPKEVHQLIKYTREKLKQ